MTASRHGAASGGSSACTTTSAASSVARGEVGELGGNVVDGGRPSEVPGGEAQQQPAIRRSQGGLGDRPALAGNRRDQRRAKPEPARPAVVDAWVRKLGPIDRMGRQVVAKRRARAEHGEQPVPKVDVRVQRVVQGERVVLIVEREGRLGGLDEVHDRLQREIGIGAGSKLGQQTEPELGSGRKQLGARRIGEAQSSEPGLAAGVPVLVAAGHASTLSVRGSAGTGRARRR